MTPNRLSRPAPPPLTTAASDHLPFSPPSAAERDALRHAAAYLRRAGNEVASRALMPDGSFGPGWAAGHAGPGAAQGGFAALHDSLRAAASLCIGVIETASDGVGPTGRRDGGEERRWPGETPREVAR